MSQLAIVALAECLQGLVIVTLDRRHFAVVRPRHRGAFELLPKLPQPSHS